MSSVFICWVVSFNDKKMHEKMCPNFRPVGYIIICKTVIHTLRTHALGGPAGAGAELSKLIGRIVSTVLGLRRRNTTLARSKTSR